MPGRRMWLVVCAALVLALASCGGGEEASSSQDSLIVGFSSAADVGDIATLEALDRLAADGTEIETVFFSQPELLTQGLLQGQVDVAVGALTTALAAVQEQDAPIRVFLNQIRNEWTLWSGRPASTCSDLEGEEVGVHSTSGASYYMLVQWFGQNNCTPPRYLVIPGSDVRASAMIAGELDTSLLEIGDALLVDGERPGSYHEVVNFAEALPDLLTIVFFTDEDSLAAKRPLLVELTKAVRETNTSLNGTPQAASDAVAERLPEAEESTRTVAQSYAELGLWPTSEGLSQEAVQYSIDFYTDPTVGALDGSKADQLRAAFDLSIVDEAWTG